MENIISTYGTTQEQGLYAAQLNDEDRTWPSEASVYHNMQVDENQMGIDHKSTFIEVENSIELQQDTDESMLEWCDPYN